MSRGDRRAAARRMRHVRCSTHGRTQWQGDMQCDKCKRVYLDCDKDHGEAPGEYCVCGARFAPPDEGGDASDEDFSARVVCRGCARRVRAQASQAAN